MSAAKRPDAARDTAAWSSVDHGSASVAKGATEVRLPAASSPRVMVSRRGSSSVNLSQSQAFWQWRTRLASAEGDWGANSNARS